MSLGNQFDIDVSNYLFNVLQMLYIYNDYVTVCIKFTKKHHVLTCYKQYQNQL